MGVSTVESHLSHVYRKLGVRRAELQHGSQPSGGAVNRGTSRPSLGLSGFRAGGPEP